VTTQPVSPSRPRSASAPGLTKETPLPKYSHFKLFQGRKNPQTIKCNALRTQFQAVGNQSHSESSSRRDPPPSCPNLP